MVCAASFKNGAHIALIHRSHLLMHEHSLSGLIEINQCKLFVLQSLPCFAESGDLRLTRGQTSEDGTAQFGQLEVFNGGGWGTVCDRSGEGSTTGLAVFSDESVAVACKQLGFAEGSKSRLSVRC